MHPVFYLHFRQELTTESQFFAVVFVKAFSIAKLIIFVCCVFRSVYCIMLLFMFCGGENLDSSLFIFHLHRHIYIYSVCVCVCARARARERVCVCLCESICVPVCQCVSICACVCVSV